MRGSSSSGSGLGPWGGDTAPIEAQLSQFLADAREEGYETRTDSKGRTIGVARAMPSVTDLVREGLDEEGLYRLLSAVAHGHHWAVMEVSFTVIPEAETPEEAAGAGFRAMEKSVSPTGMMYLAVNSAEALARTVWSQATYCGWSLVELGELLERLYDRLELAAHRRFWRA